MRPNDCKHDAVRSIAGSDGSSSRVEWCEVCGSLRTESKRDYSGWELCEYTRDMTYERAEASASAKQYPEEFYSSEKNGITYWLYADHRYSDGEQNMVQFDGFSEARMLANVWLSKGMVMVHIRKMTCTDKGITEQLVWAAANEEVNWR